MEEFLVETSREEEEDLKHMHWWWEKERKISIDLWVFLYTFLFVDKTINHFNNIPNKSPSDICVYEAPK